MQFAPEKEELFRIFELRHAPLDVAGWNVKRRQRFGYFTPDDYYEAIVDKLVTPSTRWIDVGSGRDLFPSNRRLAEELSKRAQRLVGVDPSPNIHDNPFVHARHQALLEEVVTDETFDLATLRMVAEHVTDPAGLVSTLSRLLAPGGRVVVYTINVASPASLVSYATPMWVHHAAKRVLWRTEERDTFPVAYKMNTHWQMRRVFERGGFEERYFTRLDDCRSFAGFKALNLAELSLWKVLHAAHVPYPENCLLGIYERVR
ncbi:MAG: class I SAM-dependent methyltransferase [Myxococcota bacterium]